jgi:hypothetical protein
MLTRRYFVKGSWAQNGSDGEVDDETVYSGGNFGMSFANPTFSREDTAGGSDDE